MNIEGWNSGEPEKPDICEHIRNICNSLIINNCSVYSVLKSGVEIRCDRCVKALTGRHVIP